MYNLYVVYVYLIDHTYSSYRVSEKRSRETARRTVVDYLVNNSV